MPEPPSGHRSQRPQKPQHPTKPALRGRLSTPLGSLPQHPSATSFLFPKSPIAPSTDDGDGEKGIPSLPRPCPSCPRPKAESLAHSSWVGGPGCWQWPPPAPPQAATTPQGAVPSTPRQGFTVDQALTSSRHVVFPCRAALYPISSKSLIGPPLLSLPETPHLHQHPVGLPDTSLCCPLFLATPSSLIL